MMTLPTLLLVATTLVAKTTATNAAAAGHSKRSLQEYYDEGQADGNYYDNSNDDAPFYQDSLDRLNEDVVGMWENSPSEWIEEYWEVFGAIVLLTCYLALLICICCTVHCCRERRHAHAAASAASAEDDATGYVQATDSNDGLMVVATESQVKERQQKRRFLDRLRSKNKKEEGVTPIDTTLEGVSSPDDIEEARYNQVASPIAPGEGGGGDGGEYEPPDNDVASAILRQTSPKLGSEDFDDDDDNYHRRMKVRSSRRKSSASSPSTMSNVKEMYDEVVDLWSEFLGFRKKSSGRSSKRSLMRGDERDKRFSSSGSTKHRSSRSSSGRVRRSRRSMEEMTDDNHDDNNNNTDTDQQYVDTGMSSMSQSTLSPTNATKSPPRMSSRNQRVASSSMEQPEDVVGAITNETGDDSEVV